MILACYILHNLEGHKHLNIKTDFLSRTRVHHLTFQLFVSKPVIVPYGLCIVKKIQMKMNLVSYFISHNKNIKDIQQLTSGIWLFT